MKIAWERIDSGAAEAAQAAKARKAATEAGMLLSFPRCAPCLEIRHSSCVVQLCGCNYCFEHPKWC